MPSAMKSLLVALPLTMRPTLEIHNLTQSVRLLVSNRAHGVPRHSQFLWKTALEHLSQRQQYQTPFLQSRRQNVYQNDA